MMLYVNKATMHMNTVLRGIAFGLVACFAIGGPVKGATQEEQMDLLKEVYGALFISVSFADKNHCPEIVSRIKSNVLQNVSTLGASSVRDSLSLYKSICAAKDTWVLYEGIRSAVWPSSLEAALACFRNNGACPALANLEVWWRRPEREQGTWSSFIAEARLDSWLRDLDDGQRISERRAMSADQEDVRPKDVIIPAQTNAPSNTSGLLWGVAILSLVLSLSLLFMVRSLQQKHKKVLGRIQGLVEKQESVKHEIASLKSSSSQGKAWSSKGPAVESASRKKAQAIPDRPPVEQELSVPDTLGKLASHSVKAEGKEEPVDDQNVQPTEIVIYLTVPEGVQGFMAERGTTNMHEQRSAYKLLPNIDDLLSGEFELINDALVVKRAIESPGPYLKEACTYASLPTNATRVHIEERGRVVKEGAYWVIQKKCKVRFE